MSTTELQVLTNGARHYLRFCYRFEAPKFETSVSTQIFL